MSSENPSSQLAYLARHGETEWSVSGRHTGLTDLPLTARGERNARRLGARLCEVSFERVFTSPLQRASRTCELSGFRSVAQVNRDLVEWDYGAYEGKTTAEIHQQRPEWNLFSDGCPDGESVEDVAVRANRIVELVRGGEGNVLLFSSGHFLRVLAACWLGLDPIEGRRFMLGTAALSIVGYEHGLDEPAIRLWNDQAHHGDRGS